MAYVDAGGVHTWHEVDGPADGAPTVLLHGAFSGACAWNAVTPAFVRAGYRVFRPERRGHAHTPDVDGPSTYEIMADDTVAYLETVIGAPAHLVGWSDGAVVALLVARRRPDLVGRLVLVGQYYNSDGKVTDSVLSRIRAAADENAMSYLRINYDAVSPDGPDHFPAFYAKSMARVTAEPELELTTLGDVRAPTLVLQGDHDDVRIEHSVAVTHAITGARLAVLPGGHSLPLEQPTLFAALVVAFLGADPPS